MERGYGHPDPEISGGLVSNKFFSAFRSSIWYKKSRGGGGPSPGWCILVFRPKRLKNPTLWGGTYLYSLYKGVTSPPPPGITCLVPCGGSKRGARAPTLILRPKWGPKSREKCFWKMVCFLFQEKKISDKINFPLKNVCRVNIDRIIDSAESFLIQKCSNIKRYKIVAMKYR